MTIRELQALLLLYQAAAPELRERAARLVPELAEWDKPNSPGIRAEVFKIGNVSHRIEYDRK